MNDKVFTLLRAGCHLYRNKDGTRPPSMSQLSIHFAALLQGVGEFDEVGRLGYMKVFEEEFDSYVMPSFADQDQRDFGAHAIFELDGLVEYGGRGCPTSIEVWVVVCDRQVENPAPDLERSGLDVGCHGEVTVSEKVEEV